MAAGAAAPAFADTGPKPGMAFSFSFGRPGLTISKGALLQCQRADCGDARPLQRLGPQGLNCGARFCGATAYGFAPFNRLEVTLSDGRTLRSNIFSPHGLNASYRVVVRAKTLEVRPGS
jgi:hypothetical protein